MNQLSPEKRGQVIAALVEGNSIRSVVRMTSVAKNTVAKLLVEIGAVCANYQDRALRNLKCRRVQCDEIWSFCYAKDKNLPDDKKDVFGDGSVWTWTALDAETKLIASWMLGSRGAAAAKEFMDDLASRLASRIQLTTDGHEVCVEAVADSFAADIDYAMLVKLYGEEREGEVRYSPAVCVGTRTETIMSNPDRRHISTSCVEHQNLTMRMNMRRFTRLTNAFSNKLVNHNAAISLHFMHYNFYRIHQTLRITPAMAAGVSDHVWEISELVALMDAGCLDRAAERSQPANWYGPTRQKPRER